MFLLIVESPTKVKTIEKFLGKEYKVISSYGHIRDLSKKNAGIKIENNKIELDYVTIEKAEKVIKELKKEVKKADLIFLATDNDREGEAISWHLQHLLKLIDFDKKEKNLKPYQRIVFNEISEKAIKKAIKNPGKINMNLVQSQQARRVLDRLVGFKLSPFLWKKIVRGLSAGRVQSVALKIIVLREKEIKKFKPEEHWKIEAILKSQEGVNFQSLLTKKNKKDLKLAVRNKETAEEILGELEEAKYRVSKIKKREVKKVPPAPFITSTLQQEASQKLGYSIKKTMMVAQKLYEEGLITYHRTDSFNLSADALKECYSFIVEKYGENYYNKEKRIYKKRKGTQEAHEAIRPVSLKNSEAGENQALYKLIYNRFLASQMSDALFNSLTVDSEATYNKNIYTLNAKGVTLKFDGFLKLYTSSTENEKNKIPELKEGEVLKLEKLLPEQYFTKPPARYTEASLVKELEKNGIGRPSTYASIISTIQLRNYVFKNDETKKLEPTDIGILVSDFLEAHFSNIVDLEFTAKMEGRLDEIAEGKLNWEKVVTDFYSSFIKTLEQKEAEIDKKDIVNFGDASEKCDKCGVGMIIKIGRFGKFMACSNYPDCKSTKPIKSKKEVATEETNEKCDKCKSKMVIKVGRFGKFLGCSNYPSCKNIKSIVKKIGIKCPLCEQGDLIEKKTKTKRTFYGCSNYPICNFALWQKPIDERCEKCHSLLIETKTSKKCSNKDCK